MGKSIYIEFYLGQSITKDLIKNFINSLLKGGLRPSANFHYGTYNEFRSGVTC